MVLEHTFVTLQLGAPTSPQTTASGLALSACLLTDIMLRFVLILIHRRRNLSTNTRRLVPILAKSPNDLAVLAVSSATCHFPTHEKNIVLLLVPTVH